MVVFSQNTPVCSLWLTGWRTVRFLLLFVILFDALARFLFLRALRPDCAVGLCGWVALACLTRLFLSLLFFLSPPPPPPPAAPPRAVRALGDAGSGGAAEHFLLAPPAAVCLGAALSLQAEPCWPEW